jgi:hypothetical protein
MLSAMLWQPILPSEDKCEVRSEEGLEEVLGY